MSNERLTYMTTIKIADSPAVEFTVSTDSRPPNATVRLGFRFGTFDDDRIRNAGFTLSPSKAREVIAALQAAVDEVEPADKIALDMMSAALRDIAEAFDFPPAEGMDLAALVQTARLRAAPAPTSGPTITVPLIPVDEEAERIVDKMMARAARAEGKGRRLAPAPTSGMGLSEEERRALEYTRAYLRGPALFGFGGVSESDRAWMTTARDTLHRLLAATPQAAPEGPRLRVKLDRETRPVMLAAKAARREVLQMPPWKRGSLDEPRTVESWAEIIDDGIVIRNDTGDDRRNERAHLAADIRMMLREGVLGEPATPQAAPEAPTTPPVRTVAAPLTVAGAFIEEWARKMAAWCCDNHEEGASLASAPDDEWDVLDDEDREHWRGFVRHLMAAIIPTPTTEEQGK